MKYEISITEVDTSRDHVPPRKDESFASWDMRTSHLKGQNIKLFAILRSGRELYYNLVSAGYARHEGNSEEMRFLLNLISDLIFMHEEKIKLGQQP